MKLKNILLLILLALSVTISITCQKDDIESKEETLETIQPQLPSSTTTEDVVTPRNGFVDVIFYRTSLTTDNYLLSQTTNFTRTYNLFNKTKIDSITFVSTGKGLINADRIFLKHYDVSIYFKQNRVPYKFTAFSKSGLEKFTFIPVSSTQLLTNSNTANIMKFEIQKSASVKYNYWDGNTKVSNFVKISKDGVKSDTRVLDPLSKDHNIFILPHAH